MENVEEYGEHGRKVPFSQGFAACYNRAQPEGLGWQNPYHQQAIETHEEAMRVFFKYCPTGRCGYIRGRRAPINYHPYPHIFPTRYNEIYGKGAAMRAFSEAKALAGKPVDNPWQLRPCDLFLSRSSRGLEEFEDEVQECEQLERNAQAAVNAFRWRSPMQLPNCKVSFRLDSPTSHSGYEGSCENGYPYLERLSRMPASAMYRLRSVKISRFSGHAVQSRYHKGPLELEVVMNLLAPHVEDKPRS